MNFFHSMRSATNVSERLPVVVSIARSLHTGDIPSGTNTTTVQEAIQQGHLGGWDTCTDVKGQDSEENIRSNLNTEHIL